MTFCACLPIICMLDPIFSTPDDESQKLRIQESDFPFIHIIDPGKFKTIILTCDQ